MDIPGDGSTNTLTVMYAGPGETYRLIWQETYFSLCAGAPGVGRGIGVDTPAGMEVTFNFYCRGTLTLTIPIILTYDIVSDTITSDADGLVQTWERITPRPW